MELLRLNMSNSFKTVVLMASLMGLFLFLGQALGGENGLIMAFMFSLFMNFGAYWFSSKIVLMSYRAREVTEAESPRLYGIVQRLVDAGAIADAKSLYFAGRNAECFCNGKKSGACRRGCNRRNFEHAQ